MGQNNVDMTSPLSRPFSTLTKKFSSFKRPLTLPLGNSQVLNQQQQPQSKKLRRCESMNQTTHDSIPLTKSMSMSTLDSPQISTPFFGMSLNSESEASIKKACNLADDPNLTGDRSKTFSLPLIPGKSLRIMFWFCIPPSTFLCLVIYLVFFRECNLYGKPFNQYFYTNIKSFKKIQQIIKIILSKWPTNSHHFLFCFWRKRLHAKHRILPSILKRIGT